MPELLEAELYRGALAASIGRRITSVWVDPPSYLRDSSRGGLVDGDAVGDMLIGESIDGVRRHGKVVIVDLGSGHTLAVRFGMTGRVIVDGAAPIDALAYGPQRDDEQWDRAVFQLSGGGVWRFNDSRKLGWLEFDADLSKLGPDAATIDPAALSHALHTTVALKAALLDQHRIAGLGNLLSDDALARAGLSPVRQAVSLRSDEIDVLAAAIRATIVELGQRGGSHLSDLQPQRHRDGHCPTCGERLRRASVGGRTTYWCGQCQPG